MKLPSLLLAAAALGLAPLASAQDINLLANEDGISVNTSLEIGNGRFNLSIPGIINTDIYKPVKPRVEVIDDNNLALHYPNGAEIKVSIAETKLTFAFANMPPEAKRISAGFPIARDAWQGSKFSFDDAPLQPFPEEDSRKRLFEGEAKLFTLVDPTGAGMAIATPAVKTSLTNKGPEGWSKFGWWFSFVLADHPGKTEFSLDFSSVNHP